MPCPANETRGPALAAIFAGFGWTLAHRLRLRGIADSLCQHLAQLSLGLCGFALGGLPRVHGRYVGMPEAKLNPLPGRPDMSASVLILLQKSVETGGEP